jgi:D-alanyl-D-alanine dipeptidase
MVRICDWIPGVQQELMYATDQNFTGQAIYDFSDSFLRYGTIQKLQAVSRELAEQGLYLKIWDSFRPVSAQFALWEVCPNPTYVADPTKGHSAHSRGNTLDLTLVAIDPATLNPLPDPDAPPLPEGEEPLPTVGPDGELIMQTPMHDLTWYSERLQNNANAQLLREIMEGAGFGGIASEWWHYQDNDTLNTFAPPALWDGVTPEGWVTEDGENWRYRNQFGEYLTDCTECIDGEFYYFNADGYAVG